MSKDFNCSICSSNDGAEVITLKNYPAYIVPLPAALAPGVVKSDLTLFVCKACGHMQLQDPDEAIQKLIYEVYYSHYVVDSSESFIPHYRIPFTAFIQKLILDNLLPKGNLLEIGCASGEKVDFFSSISHHYTGVDPSERIELARKNHPDHKFIKGYFPQALPNDTFDVIVSQFNLEHILNVNQFIQNIHEGCNENGILLVQVPDCEFFLRTHQPIFLAHEHIQYFTKNSLTVLLERNGFKPIAWGEVGPSLITAAIKSEKSDTIDKNRAAINLKNAFTQGTLLKNAPTLPVSNIIFYGVGPQLYWLLGNYKGHMDDICVVEDNPNYLKQGLPGYKTVIEKISAEMIREKGVIVLSLNNIYHQQVIEKIKSFKIPCTIIFPEGDGWDEIKYEG